MKAVNNTVKNYFACGIKVDKIKIYSVSQECSRTEKTKQKKLHVFFSIEAIAIITMQSRNLKRFVYPCPIFRILPSKVALLKEIGLPKALLNDV